MFHFLSKFIARCSIFRWRCPFLLNLQETSKSLFWILSKKGCSRKCPHVLSLFNLCVCAPLPLKLIDLHGLDSLTFDESLVKKASCLFFYFFDGSPTFLSPTLFYSSIAKSIYALWIQLFLHHSHFSSFLVGHSAKPRVVQCLHCFIWHHPWLLGVFFFWPILYVFNI